MSNESTELTNLRLEYLNLWDLAERDEENGDEESYGETMRRICLIERRIEGLEDKEQ